MREIFILGAGAWGNALALVLARNGHSVTLCSTSKQRAGDLFNSRVCDAYVDYLDIRLRLPSSVHVVHIDSVDATKFYDLLVVASTASQYRVEFLSLLPIRNVPVLIATKAIHQDTGELMPGLFSRLTRHDDKLIGVISGPNLAEPIAKGKFAGAVIAFKDEERQDEVASLFESTNFRVDRSSDRDGIALAGAGKNAIAVIVGLAEGLGYDKNGVGYVLGKTFSELGLIGGKLGVSNSSFYGIAGTGDTWTSASDLSRNYKFGFSLADKGRIENVPDIDHTTVEGIANAHGLVALAKTLGLEHSEIPILYLLSCVLKPGSDPEHVSVTRAEKKLLSREPRRSVRS